MTQSTVHLTAGQAVVRYLAAQWSEFEGVRRRVIPATFGIFGHGNVCGLGQALEQYPQLMPFYQPKNEQAMVHTAIGFAKANDRLSTFACSASIGPGSTNMVTGAATATVNRIPVLLLPSDTFANRLEGPPMQSLDHLYEGDLTVNDCFRPVSRFFDRISRPEQLLSALPEAVRVLLDPVDTGAVTLSLHQDVQGEAYDFPARFFEEHIWNVSRRPVAQSEIDAAVQLLLSANRPLLIAGGGVHYSLARSALHLFAEQYGIPVAETSAGKGALVDGSMSVGAIGHSGTRAANSLAREADVIICVGTRLIDLTTGSNSLFQDPNVRFIGVNVSSSHAHRLGALPVVGDARFAIEGISDGLADAGWSSPQGWQTQVTSVVDEWRSDVEKSLVVTADEQMSQSQVISVLNTFATADDFLVVASGTPHVDIHKLWDCARGTRVLMEVGFSCMGHEIPAALGVRLARPEAGSVYVFIGDGTYLMANTELVTAVQEHLNITVIVIVNHGFQSIHALQQKKIGRSFGLEFRERSIESSILAGETISIDFATNARSMGCAAFEVNDLEQFREALESAEEISGPVVIVAHVEPYKLSLGSDCWWEVGVAETSIRQETQRAFAEHAKGRATVRNFS